LRDQNAVADSEINQILNLQRYKKMTMSLKTVETFHACLIMTSYFNMHCGSNKDTVINSEPLELTIKSFSFTPCIFNLASTGKYVLPYIRPACQVLHHHVRAGI
jgi:hypothetical protein